MNFDAVEKELNDFLKQYERKQDYRKKLSEAVKLAFARQFEGQENVFCYANGIPDNDYKLINGDSEFVYDFVAVQESKETDPLVPSVNFIERILVCLETELDGALIKVLEDFQKLLLSHAPDKVMFFKCHSSEYDCWTKCLLEHLDRFREKSGNFHLIASINDELKIRMMLNAHLKDNRQLFPSSHC